MGAILLALSFSTHEMMLFPVAILCVVAGLLNFSKYWKPILICIGVAALLSSAELLVYSILKGDALARIHTSLGGANLEGISESGFSTLGFYLWPIGLLLNLKPFGMALGLLLVGGAICWRRLSETERVLYIITFCTWAWFGWGSISPFEYRPLWRQTHYYGPVAVGLTVLLPGIGGRIFETRPWMGKLLFSGLLVTLFCQRGGWLMGT